jgi:hypothetical protein
MGAQNLILYRMRFPRLTNLFFKSDERPTWLFWLLLPIGVLLGLLSIPLMALDPKSWKFDKEEARALLKEHLKQYEAMSFDQLRAKLSDETQHCVTVCGSSGEEYQIEVDAIWEENQVRLIGGIDDGRLRAFHPLCEEIFIARAES